MVERFFRSKDDKPEAKPTSTKVENKPANVVTNASSVTDDYRTAVKQMIETEVGAIIQEEIRKAARELADEQKRAIREAIDQHRQIIREVVEEEKLTIHSKVEELRRSITSLGMGQSL